MIKFIIAGDLHWRGSNPRARRDDYMEALSTKLTEIFNLAHRYYAPVIIPGDIFDSPTTAWRIVGLLIAKLKSCPTPILTIPGNHDIFGSNPDSAARTPYGLLELIGAIRDVSNEPFAWKSPLGNDSWARVTGYGYRASTDTAEGRWQFNAPELEEYAENPQPGYVPTARIHLVHSNLMINPPVHDMRHTLVGEVKTNANVVISGHYHPGLGSGEVMYRRKDGVLFVNPGALARTAASASDLSRQVGVVMLIVRRDGHCDAEWIPLESAKPGEEVLSREHLDAAEEREERLQDFLELLAEEGQARFLEMSEIIEDIAERDKLPGGIKDEALRRLSEAREALGVQ